MKPSVFSLSKALIVALALSPLSAFAWMGWGSAPPSSATYGDSVNITATGGNQYYFAPSGNYGVWVYATAPSGLGYSVSCKINYSVAPGGTLAGASSGSIPLNEAGTWTFEVWVVNSASGEGGSFPYQSSGPGGLLALSGTTTVGAAPAPTNPPLSVTLTSTVTGPIQAH